MLFRFSIALFPLLIFLSTITVAHAQDCGSSRASVVDVVPEIALIASNGRVIARSGPLTQLGIEDRRRVRDLVLAFLHRMRMQCGHEARVAFTMDVRSREYEVNIRIREPADRCWEQAQSGVRIFRQNPDGTTVNRSPRGRSPVAAAVDATMNGVILSTAMRILCPGESWP